MLRRSIMSDRIAATATVAAEAAESTIEAYAATWNETDAARRQACIARAWSHAGRYRDPIMASDGPAEIDAMLAAVQGFLSRPFPLVACGALIHSIRHRKLGRPGGRRSQRA
jgi:hypothetical protein